MLLFQGISPHVITLIENNPCWWIWWFAVLVRRNQSVGNYTRNSSGHMSRSSVSSGFLALVVYYATHYKLRQAAIVRGAAIRGLGDIKPMSRRSRRHYGFQLDLLFDPSQDHERDRYTNLFDRSDRAKGTMVWAIKMVAYFAPLCELVTYFFHRVKQLTHKLSSLSGCLNRG
jgi:hypothetical protein